MTEQFYYLKSNVEGMIDDERILFIYGELVKVLGQGLEFMRQGDIERRVTAINKATEIISALNSILNVEGGIITAHLRSLYFYTINQLSKANYSKSEQIMSDIVHIYRELHQTWSEKITKDKNESNQHESASFSSSEPRQTLQRQMGGVELYG
jgi:flagellar biosynthetic protein FliS